MAAPSSARFFRKLIVLSFRAFPAIVQKLWMTGVVPQKKATNATHPFRPDRSRFGGPGTRTPSQSRSRFDAHECTVTDAAFAQIPHDPSHKTFNWYRIIGNYQMYEVLDDTAAQIILAIESGDSIRRVAQTLQTPYETVRGAVDRLEDAGYVRYDDGLVVVDDRVREAARELVAASARVSPPAIEEAYVVPHFAGLPFAFTRIDAVYVWTQGGYQVGRDPDDYPLFLAVRERDVDAWKAFFDSFALPTAFERQPRDELGVPLQIVLEPRPSLDVERIEGYPVIPRPETIEYMREHYAQCQSALAMLDRMYGDLDLDVAYRETERA